MCCIWVLNPNSVILKLITSELPLFRCSRTISMETGCQNIQLCVVILKVAFPPQVIGPMFLFPLIYITLQCTEALLLALCFRCYQTFKSPAEGKCHSCLCVFVVKLGGGIRWVHRALHAFVLKKKRFTSKSHITILLLRCKQKQQCGH